MIAEKRRLLRTYMTQVFRGANVNLQNWRQVTVQYNRLSRGQKRLDGSWFELRTHTGECTVTACCTKIKCEKEAAFFMANQIMRITLKAYDHKLIDKAAAQIVDTVKKTGAKVSGPVPMPTKIEKITILRAVHKYKDSREQFEQRTHKRLIDVVAPTQKTIDALQKIDLSAGVFIDVKMK